jgi:hypothetical protein
MLVRVGATMFREIPKHARAAECWFEDLRFWKVRSLRKDPIPRPLKTDGGASLALLQKILVPLASRSRGAAGRTEYGATDCAMLLFVSLGKCRRNNIHERPPTNQEHSDGWRIGAFRGRLIRATVKAQTIPTPEV